MLDNGFLSNTGCNIMAQNNHNLNTRYLSFVENTMQNSRRGGLCLREVHQIGAEKNSIDVSDERAYCYHVDRISTAIFEATLITVINLDIEINLDSELIWTRLIVVSIPENMTVINLDFK